MRSIFIGKVKENSPQASIRSVGSTPSDHTSATWSGRYQKELPHPGARSPIFFLSSAYTREIGRIALSHRYMYRRIVLLTILPESQREHGVAGNLTVKDHNHQVSNNSYLPNTSFIVVSAHPNRLHELCEFLNASWDRFGLIFSSISWWAIPPGLGRSNTYQLRKRREKNWQHMS